jgi:hypothetical protein
MAVLVIAEHHHGALSDATHKVVTAALKFGGRNIVCPRHQRIKLRREVLDINQHRLIGRWHKVVSYTPMGEVWPAGKWVGGVIGQLCIARRVLKRNKTA